MLLLALAAIAGALLHDTDRDGNIFWRLAREIVGASRVTGGVLLISAVAATLLGIVVACMRASHVRWLQFLAGMYVETFRGIPLLPLLLFVYFGVNPLLAPEKTGLELDLRLDRFASAIVAISCCYAAFIGEAIRAGIEAIPHEEIEAASLEAGPLLVFRHVILPQALRIVLPPWTNEMTAMLKDTSLVYGVGLADITWRAKEIGASTGRFFEAYAAVSAVYLVLTLVLSRLARWMERRWHDDVVVETPTPAAES